MLAITIDFSHQRQRCFKCLDRRLARPFDRPCLGLNGGSVNKVQAEQLCVGGLPIEFGLYVADHKFFHAPRPSKPGKHVRGRVSLLKAIRLDLLSRVH